MKVTKGYIADAKGSLEIALNLPSDRMTEKGKYWLAKLGRLLTPALKEFQEDLNELVRTYGHKVPAGYEVSGDDDREGYAEAVKQLRDIECEIAWNVIRFGPKEGASLNGGHRMSLDAFFDFPEPVDEDTSPTNGKAEKMPELAVVK